MTPALMGLTLAGWSDFSTPFKPSVSHIFARFAGALAIVAYVAVAVPSSGVSIG